MRVPLFGAVCLAGALIAEAFAAPNSAHVCGDVRLSSQDQMDCRAQMDAARTESDRLRVQGAFEKLGAATANEAGSNVAAKRNAARKTSDTPAPQTNPSTKPSDSYPPAVTAPPVYPGEVPNPKTGKPPA